MVHLITGYYGYEHIKSADQRAFNAAFFGDGQNVLDFGNKFAASIVDNNTVRIADGEGLMFGGHFRIETNTYEDVTIATGTAGANRIDLICVTYKKNEVDGTEQTYLEVIKGTEASSPTVPAYTTGNLLEGAIFNQMPLYKVNIDGVVLSSVEKMFETIPTYKALAEQYAAAFEGRVAEASANLMPKSGGTFTNQTSYETTNQQPITFDMPNAEIGVTPNTAQVAMLAVRDKNDAVIGKFQVAQHTTGVTETVLSASDETGTANLSVGLTTTGEKFVKFNNDTVITSAGGTFTDVVHAKLNKREITYGTGEVINCSVRASGGGSAVITSFLRFDRK